MLRVAAADAHGGCTEAESKERTALLDVGCYAVFLDLAADPGRVRSRAEIRFRCREPAAATFADLRASVAHQVTCNGASMAGGRWPVRLPVLAARLTD
jgi:aminopeptidase N